MSVFTLTLTYPPPRTRARRAVARVALWLHRLGDMLDRWATK